MNCFKKWMAIAVFAIAVTSCNDQADPKEEAEIKTMDSTTIVVKENKEKLDEQTKKVEGLLENLEKQFDSTN